MQSSNFELGNDKYKGLPLKSTYKSSIASDTDFAANAKKEKVDVDSKKTTIDIGKGRSYGYTSESKSKFKQPSGHSQTIDQETKNNLNFLKQNHFELGQDRNDFSTVNKTDFSAKANPGYKKHTSNIQKTSFVMGFQGNPFNSSSPSSNQPAYTDRPRNVPYQRVVGEAPRTAQAKAGNVMQKENFSLGKNGGDFRTMNQAYYRWIQPRGDIKN